MNARGQRSLARIICRETAEVVQERRRNCGRGILDERDAILLRIRIPDARARGAPLAEIPHQSILECG